MQKKKRAGTNATKDLSSQNDCLSGSGKSCNEKLALLGA